MNNPHQEHRKRMKQRFLEKGFDAMAEHEILELALYFCIPFKNTNPIAHRLLDEFGSIRQILKTDPVYLQNVPGIGENSAVFFRFLKAFIEYYEAGDQREIPVLKDYFSARDYVGGKLRFSDVEQFLLICLDSNLRLIHCEVMSHGSINQVDVNVRKIVEEALKFKTHSVILAHNHPCGTARPTAEDDAVTTKLYQAFASINICLMDHLIVGEDGTFSYNQSERFALIESRLPKDQRFYLAQNPAGYPEKDSSGTKEL